MTDIVTTRKLLLASAFILILSGIFIFASNNGNAVMPPLLADVAIRSSNTINIDDLVDHNEKIVDSDRFSGHWTFVFFGFTNCPDVCPATLSQLVQINKRLHEQMPAGDKPQFFFVSVDPGRDTTKHLADYMAYFDPAFIGMSGSEKAISVIEKQLGAFHRLGKKDITGYYSVQHSADVFLIDPERRLAAKFTPPMDINRVLTQFELFVELYAQKAYMNKT